MRLRDRAGRRHTACASRGVLHGAGAVGWASPRGDGRRTHVPHPTRPDISQAVYLKGTSGIEIDLVDIQDYIDEGKNIEFSLVFKEEYNVWTYDVFVGCGGCASAGTRTSSPSSSRA